ncbi:MAG: phage tail assembly protein [Candidatus Gastranaerophilales bacterium]|nr:phage tail assembly protein [Candidatus Gastranaerophilales bacterium]
MSKKDVNPEITKENDESSVNTADEFCLSNGTIVKFRKSTGRDVINARQRAGSKSSLVGAHVIAEIASFDGDKLTYSDLLDLDVADYLLLEEKWNEFASGKNSQQQET